MARRRVLVVTGVAGALATCLLAGCGSSGGPGGDPAAAEPGPDPSASPSPEAPSPSAPAPSASSPAAPSPTAPPPAKRAARPPREPRVSTLSIPALGLTGLPVVRYPGTPDDAEGTRIQNRGRTASPRGPGGGVGPGMVGNYIVTGHRTSHGSPFRHLPDLGPGDRVRVRSGGTVHVYEIVGTRRTSFRSARSLAQQSAAVPGRPGASPVRPMITLSTCATPEDHAAGNFWSDRFGNPEHRIDKIGVLVARRSARG